MSTRIGISREQVEREWASRGFTCFLWVDLPGTVWADFVHDEDELMVLLEGTVLLDMGGRVLRLVAGDEVLIPAGERHTLRTLGDRPGRWLYGYRRIDQIDDPAR